MRCRVLVLVAAGLVAAGGARAGTLVSATWIADLGFLGPSLAPLPFAVPVGATGTSTGSAVSASLVMPAFAQDFILPQSPSRPLNFHIPFTLGGAQVVTATAGMAVGSPAVLGSVRVRNAEHVLMGTKASMLTPAMTTFVKIPLALGAPGSYVAPLFLILGAYHYLTVDFYGWTPGTVAIPGLTSDYTALPTPTISAMGSFMLTSMGGGTVTLVSPTRIAIDGPLAQRRAASFTTLHLTFVPEPQAMALLLLAAGALVMVTRRRTH
jgi:hypothetical protein